MLVNMCVPVRAGSSLLLRSTTMRRTRVDQIATDAASYNKERAPCFLKELRRPQGIHRFYHLEWEVEKNNEFRGISLLTALQRDMGDNRGKPSIGK
jgi:hypothetical protein